jgi:hypothetical protein
MRGLLHLQGTRLTLFTLTLLSAWGCLPATYDNVTKMRFSTVGKIPVVSGKINGKNAYFIIDTGASCSILNQSGSVHYGFAHLAHAGDQVTGLGGKVDIHQAVNCLVEFGPLKLRHMSFRTKNLDYLTDIIKQQESITIDGIIGSDILNRYGISIDFKHNLICFNQ